MRVKTSCKCYIGNAVRDAGEVFECDLPRDKLPKWLTPVSDKVPEKAQDPEKGKGKG